MEVLCEYAVFSVRLDNRVIESDDSLIFLTSVIFSRLMQIVVNGIFESMMCEKESQVDKDRPVMTIFDITVTNILY